VLTLGASQELGFRLIPCPGLDKPVIGFSIFALAALSLGDGKGMLLICGYNSHTWPS